VKLVALIIPLISTIFTVLIPLLPDISGFEFLSRNSEELFTANSRTLIWSVIISDISNISFQTLFGSGEYGNLAYQSSQNYLTIFQNFMDSDIKSSHNTFFQIILDLGYVFLIFFIFVLSKCINNLFNNKNNNVAKLFIISFLTFLICGTTEVLIGSYYMPINFLIFMMIFYINNNPSFKTTTNAL
jgi:O-antigen ligase